MIYDETELGTGIIGVVAFIRLVSVGLQVPITKVIIIQDAATLWDCIMPVHGPLWRLLHEVRANCGKPITVSIRRYTYILNGGSEPRVLKL